MKTITTRKFSKLVKKFQKKGIWFDVKVGWDETEPNVLVYRKGGKLIQNIIS